MSSSPVYDSQDSVDLDQPILNTIKDDNIDSFSDDSLGSLSNDDSYNIILQPSKQPGKSDKLEDQILNRLSKTEATTLVKRCCTDFIEVEQFSLGDEYDPKIAKHIESIKNANKNVQADLVINNKSTSRTELITLKIKSKLEQHIYSEDILNHYISMIVRDTVSDRYKDWHFFTKTSRIKDIDEVISAQELFIFGEDWKAIQKVILKTYPSFQLFLNALGVSTDLLKIIDNKKLSISQSYDHDSLCQILPINAMMTIIPYYHDQPDFVTLFLCFILDRKVYESQECSTEWCEELLVKYEHEVFDSYLSLVEPDNYFIHNRFSKMIPIFKKKLELRLLFDADGTVTIILNEFNRLFDAREFKNLLQFILFIYGTDNVQSLDDLIDLRNYFSKCIHDVSNESTTEVELTLLKGIIGVFDILYK